MLFPRVRGIKSRELKSPEVTQLELDQVEICTWECLCFPVHTMQISANHDWYTDHVPVSG